ncbi:MAG: ABC transporter permease [Bacteroidota bacterium]
MNLFRKKKIEERSYSLGKQAWAKFKDDKMSFFSLWFIVIVSFLTVFSYLIIPDKTPFSNRQILEIAGKYPGFSIKMLKIQKNQNENSSGFINDVFLGKEDNCYFLPIDSIWFEKENVHIIRYSGWEGIVGKKEIYSLPDVLFAIDKKQSVICNGETVVFTTIDGKKLEKKLDELKAQVTENSIIEKKFILGTDPMGRDLLSRIVVGARVSLAVGLISVFLSIVIGLLVGLVGGYWGGRVDAFFMWLINVVWSIPTLLLVIAITFVLGKGFWQVFIAVGLTMWVEVARVVRGQVLGVKEKEYIDAAKVLGYSNWRIILKHILPNVLGPVIVISAANFASAILLEAGLSFLGIGVQPPMPSWGSMVKDYYGYLLLDKAYLAILPGICIMFLVLAFMILGNGLRDALDTKN